MVHNEVDLIKFKFHTMHEKYKGFMAILGVDWDNKLQVGCTGGLIDIRLIRDNFPMVTLNDRYLSGSKMDVKDWCQQHFGDRWIYDYSNYYFHNQKDANWFRLRWG